MFFASNIGPVNATLPGLRFQGLCAPEYTPLKDLWDPFTEVCQPIRGPNHILARANISSPELRYSLAACCKVGSEWLNTSPTSNTGWFAYTYEGSAGNGTGLVSCNSTFTLGNATLHGANAQFDSESFKPLTVTFRKNPNIAKPLSDPMASLFYQITAGSLVTPEESEMTLSGLGMNPRLTPGSDTVTHSTPNVTEVAQRIWSGFVHEVAVLGMLSATNDKPYSATSATSVPVHARMRTFAIIAYVLLGVWAALIVFLTAIAWRKAPGSTLDTYTATGLVQRRAPWLIQESDGGNLAENAKMRLRFSAA